MNIRSFSLEQWEKVVALWRRAGIQLFLVAETEDGRIIGAVMGCDKINLLIEPENGAVQAFYEKQGFNRDELIFMEKWITPAQTSAKGV